MNLTDFNKMSVCEQAANELLNLNGWPKPRSLCDLASRYGVDAADIQACADRMAANFSESSEVADA